MTHTYIEANPKIIPKNGAWCDESHENHFNQTQITDTIQHACVCNAITDNNIQENMIVFLRIFQRIDGQYNRIS